MAQLVEAPIRITAHGKPPKVIEEFVGVASTGTTDVSVARMVSPPGWAESGQAPGFDEYTVVLKGSLRVETTERTFDVNAGQAVRIQAGEWVRYSTPGSEGAEYIAVCRPAFSPDSVNRDSENG